MPEIDSSEFEWADDEGPMTRRTTAARLRIGVAVATLALVAGAVGFAVGRTAGSGTADRAVGATPDGPASPTTSARSAPTTPPSAESTAAPASDVAPADTVAPAMQMESTDAARPANVPMAVGATGGQYSPNAYPEERRELLAERTTDEDVTMRVHIVRYDGASMYLPFGPIEGWTPAGWCYPSGDLRVSVATPTSVNVSWASWFAEPKDGLAVTSFAAGYVEGAPMFGVVAQVGTEATRVTFTTVSGATDTATPTNGVALLIVPGPIENDFVIDVERGTAGTVTASAADLSQPGDSSEYRDACEPPPPALPDAGEQPADARAAEAAVLDAWRTANDGFNETDTRLAFVDDVSGLAEAWEALQAGQYGEAARTSTRTITELVFTSPTEAWFRYDIETSIMNFYNRYGMARLNSAGTWQITRQTMCQDVALAPGFGCTPAVDQLLPPSAANDPRFDPMPVEG